MSKKLRVLIPKLWEYAPEEPSTLLIDVDVDENIGIPCDAFEFDESKAITVRHFFSRYKDQFPMMAIIKEGYYGDTPFDCYDTCQVLRCSGQTSQPRVVAMDETEARRQRHQYLSIPVETPVKFRVVKSHKEVGPDQDLKILLEENKLPVLVQIACNRKYRIRVGTEWKTAPDYGNLLITKKFEERFMLIHCLYSRDLKLSEFVNLLALTDEMCLMPITGFKPEIGTKEDFEAYMKKLAEHVEQDKKKPGNRPNYDPERGNPDWGICFLETKSLATGSGGVTSDYAPLVPFDEIFPDNGPPPALPPRKGTATPSGPYQSTIKKLELTEEDVYEVIDPDYHMDDASKAIKTKSEPSKEPDKKKKSLKSSEKEFKHLDKSIKQKKEQLKHVPNPEKKSKVANDVIDTKQSSKENDAKVNDSDCGFEPATPTGEDDRYVKLTRPVKGHGYQNMKVTTNTPDSQKVPISQFDGQIPAITKKRGENYTREDVAKMTIEELGECLRALKLDEYIPVFKEQMVDGAIMQDLSTEDFMTEFKVSRVEAVRLTKFASTGHIPK